MPQRGASVWGLGRYGRMGTGVHGCAASGTTGTLPRPACSAPASSTHRSPYMVGLMLDNVDTELVLCTHLFSLQVWTKKGWPVSKQQQTGVFVQVEAKGGGSRAAWYLPVADKSLQG